MEKYENETRESFLDRADHLTFRIDDGTTQHSFFESGRPDKMREAIISHNNDVALTLLYQGRCDNCVRYSRSVTVQQCREYEAFFADHPNRLASVHMVLSSHQSIEVGSDSPTSVYRDKVLHIALKYTPQKAGDFVEVYQDIAAHSLRVVVHQENLGKKTVMFDNHTPTEDPLYESAKALVLQAVQQIVGLEREVYLNYFPTRGTETQEELVALQHQRLHDLSSSLFRSLDELSSPQK